MKKYNILPKELQELQINDESKNIEQLIEDKNQY